MLAFLLSKINILMVSEHFWLASLLLYVGFPFCKNKQFDGFGAFLVGLLVAFLFVFFYVDKFSPAAMFLLVFGPLVYSKIFAQCSRFLACGLAPASGRKR